jgi:uncharacterized membrane protein
MMSTTTDTEVVQYLARVRAALTDLPEGERDDLLDDLESHLAEVLDEVTAESAGGTLESRLGSPEEYAAELRAAAGLAAAAPRRRRPDLRPALAAAQTRPWVRDTLAFLPELRPGWWVLRGLIVAAGIAVLAQGGVALAVALALLAVPASVWLGRRIAVGRWRLARLVLNVVIGLTGLVLLVNHDTAVVTYPSSESPAYPLPVGDGSIGSVTNLYPYAKDGTPLHDVLLYDQDGNPVVLTDSGYGPGGELVRRYPYTPDGRAIQNAYPQDQAYQDTSTDPPVIRRQTPPAVTVPQFATPTAEPSGPTSGPAVTGAQPTPTGTQIRPAPGGRTPTPTPTPR